MRTATKTRRCMTLLAIAELAELARRHHQAQQLVAETLLLAYQLLELENRVWAKNPANDVGLCAKRDATPETHREKRDASTAAASDSPPATGGGTELPGARGESTDPLIRDIAEWSTRKHLYGLEEDLESSIVNETELADAIRVTYFGYEPSARVLGRRWPVGHAAIIAVNPKTGRTRYFEYGPYDSAFGNVRTRTVPDVKMGPDGKPTPESLAHLLRYASNHFGQGKPVIWDYDRAADFAKVVNFANKEMRNEQRAPYNLLTNNCYIFQLRANFAGYGW